MKVIEFWVIYHPQLGKEKLTAPENYFLHMTGIGPAFGATFKTTPWLMSIREASDVLASFPMMVLAEVQHVGFVVPEEATFPTRGLVEHYTNLAMQEAVDKTVANIRALPLGDYIMGGPDRPQTPEEKAQSKRFYDHISRYAGRSPREAQEKEDSERAAVREQKPGRRVQLDARGPEPQEVEAEDCSSGEAGGSDRPEAPCVEGVPSAEGGDDGGVDVQSYKLYLQPMHGTALGEAPLRPGVAYMSKGTFEDITRSAAEPEPEHTQDPDGDWPRCGGDTICEICGKTFYKHPLDGPEGFQGKFLNRICDGRLVKL